MRESLKIASLMMLCVSATAGYADSSEVEERRPHVTYISGDSVYVSAGLDQGLEENDELRVVRGTELVTILRVHALSSRRALCTVAPGLALPSVGDIVELPREAGSGTDSGNAPRVLVFARISHIDQDAVFIDSGEESGMHGGDRLEVVREGVAVAELEVTDVGQNRSGCTVVRGRAALETGDVVRIPYRETAATPIYPRSDLQTTVVVSSAASNKPRTGRLRGRVGVRYLSVRDRQGQGADLSQPALDLRLDGGDMGQRHLDVAVDVRSRRTYRAPVDESSRATDQTRVYRMAATVHDADSRYRMTVGRQFSPSLATVSTFDGVLLDYGGDRWSTGLFGGTQPAVEDYGYSTDIKEYGAFVQAHNRRSNTRPWSVTLGAIGSYQLGEINREFAYVQSLYSGQRLTFYATEEIDYNRDWKIVDGEDPLTLTSSYAHLTYRIGQGFSLRAGYDNRRTVRLYRDHITPEVEFDDSFRRGAWIGLSQRVTKKFRFGLDAKSSHTETSGDADTYTLTLGLSGLTHANFSSYYRGSRYSNMTVEGQLHSLSSSVSLTRQVRLILSGGWREDTNNLDPLLDSQLVWYGVETDVNLGRHWFLMLSGERSEGENERTEQSYLSVMYRF